MVKKITLFVDCNNNEMFMLDESVANSISEIPIDTSDNPTIFVEFAKKEMVVYGEQVLVEDDRMMFAYCFIDESILFDENKIEQKLYDATISFLQDKQRTINNIQTIIREMESA